MVLLIIGFMSFTKTWSRFLGNWCEFHPNFLGVSWFLYSRNMIHLKMCPIDSSGTTVVDHFWHLEWFCRWGCVMGNWWQFNSFKFVNATKSLNFDKYWMDVSCYLLIKNYRYHWARIWTSTPYKHYAKLWWSNNVLLPCAQCNELTFK
jgi:hypothetical protein